MKDESIEPGSPGWLERLVDDAAGTPMFSVKSLLDDGWHSGDIAVFYIRYAYDKQFRELIQFCDTHKLRFEILCKDNASTFRLIVCRVADYQMLLQTGEFSDSSAFRANDT
jgi:hypothetical protein